MSGEAQTGLELLAEVLSLQIDRSGMLETAQLFVILLTPVVTILGIALTASIAVWKIKKTHKQEYERWLKAKFIDGVSDFIGCINERFDRWREYCTTMHTRDPDKEPSIDYSRYHFTSLVEIEKQRALAVMTSDLPHVDAILDLLTRWAFVAGPYPGPSHCELAVYEREMLKLSQMYRQWLIQLSNAMRPDRYPMKKRQLENELALAMTEINLIMSNLGLK